MVCWGSVVVDVVAADQRGPNGITGQSTVEGTIMRMMVMMMMDVIMMVMMMMDMMLVMMVITVTVML